MKEIKFKKDTVEVDYSGGYYTSVRSVHYDKENKIVRISYQSDRCTDEEFLNYLYQELPELKKLSLVNVYYDEAEWLCDWNVGEPKGGAFMLVVFFFK